MAWWSRRRAPEASAAPGAPEPSAARFDPHGPPGPLLLALEAEHRALLEGLATPLGRRLAVSLHWPWAVSRGGRLGGLLDSEAPSPEVLLATLVALDEPGDPRGLVAAYVEADHALCRSEEPVPRRGEEVARSLAAAAPDPDRDLDRAWSDPHLERRRALDAAVRELADLAGLRLDPAVLLGTPRWWPGQPPGTFGKATRDPLGLASLPRSRDGETGGADWRPAYLTLRRLCEEPVPGLDPAEWVLGSFVSGPPGRGGLGVVL